MEKEKEKAAADEGDEGTIERSHSINLNTVPPVAVGARSTQENVGTHGVGVSGAKDSITGKPEQSSDADQKKLPKCERVDYESEVEGCENPSDKAALVTVVGNEGHADFRDDERAQVLSIVKKDEPADEVDDPITPVAVTAYREEKGASAEISTVRPAGSRSSSFHGVTSVIVEALKMDSLQRLCSSLEPILRRVVSEEVERALGRLGPATITGRSSPKRIEGPDGRALQLQFRTRLSLPLFTGGKVEGEQGAAIHVVLLDVGTGCVVSSGPESSAKLDIVVLEGDFNNEDEEGWTGEEFDSHVVKEREGKRPILTGDLQVTLKEGVGTIGELTFTDNSSWIRSRKFRLGLKIASGFCEGVRIREAKTEAFMVKDHRGELYKKHYPPTLKDEVWRLEKIGKDGSFHKRLNKSGISTVEDFLRLVVRDPQKLRSILGSGMSNKMWETLVEHAKTCVLSGKYYIYYSDEDRSIGAIFNNIYAFCGLISGEQFYSSESLDDSQKDDDVENVF
nr:unnamed protein product [Digitaria exilis]